MKKRKLIVVMVLIIGIAAASNRPQRANRYVYLCRYKFSEEDKMDSPIILQK